MGIKAPYPPSPYPPKGPYDFIVTVIIVVSLRLATIGLVVLDKPES